MERKTSFLHGVILSHHFSPLLEKNRYTTTKKKPNRIVSRVRQKSGKKSGRVSQAFSKIRRKWIFRKIMFFSSKNLIFTKILIQKHVTNDAFHYGCKNFRPKISFLVRISIFSKKCIFGPLQENSPKNLENQCSYQKFLLHLIRHSRFHVLHMRTQNL